jgi:SAM-dependent methyltransferase
MSSDIFHYDGLRYWGPVSEDKMEIILDLTRVGEGARVIDLGCGRGELLIRLVERYDARAVGVDSSRAALGMLRGEADLRVPEGAIEVVDSELAAFEPSGPYELVAWLGGPFLGADFRSTATALADWVRPGGYLLIGHGFWAADPPAPYLEATGLEPSELGTHWDNLELLHGLGLRSLYTAVASRDEWDEFEGRILYNVERYAAAHPEAPDPQGRLDQRRRWHQAQQRWGRDVMGFGLYLLQR